MEILHICSDFAKQGIYNQLVSYLANLGVTQKIYVPVRTAKELNGNRNNSLSNVDYYYSNILNKVDRIFYNHKIRKTSKDLLSHFNLKNTDLIHAHFLFSDGGNAYEIYKKTGIPYIVAVRNTDINIFFKYCLHLRSYALSILLNAKRIIFLSPEYQKALFNKYIPTSIKNILGSKSVVVPNGIDKYWLENCFSKEHTPSKKMWNALYVGDFTKNKNVHISIKTLLSLRKKGLKINFTIVGGGGNNDAKIRNLAKENSNWITLLDRITNKNQLLSIYREADFFIMPSRFETFGLVYIEAMSQGLPLIYTQGQGIDGYFKEGKVGYAVPPEDINIMSNKIIQILNNYQTISNNCNYFAMNFSWDKISKIYSNLYKEVLNQNKC